MTTDTDKLVEMAVAAGGMQLTSGNVALSPEELAAFRAAIIASLCGDVEQDGFRLVSVNAGFTELLEALDRADRKGYMPDAIYSAYEGFECRDPASTVAALKARVAELEKDTARLEFVCNSPNRMVERENGLWRVYEDVAPADHPTSVWQGITPRWHVTPREAIDAAITAALTKGQP